MGEQHNKPFKIKLHPLLDEKTLNAISDATLAAIKDQLYKPLALTPDDIGKDIKGEGIYLGTYAPVDRDGISLKKVFNVFAAPEDLPGIRTYNGTVAYLSSLENWHGHDGTNYTNNKELYAALKDGTYNGAWIIPTRELLNGTKEDGDNDIRLGRIVQPGNLLDHKNQAALKHTFSTKAAWVDQNFYPQWYWSCTEGRNKSSVFTTKIPDGKEGWDDKNDYKFSCRPVRLVAIK